MKKDPAEAKKLSSEAFTALGDTAVGNALQSGVHVIKSLTFGAPVVEFTNELEHSTFGVSLSKTVKEADRNGTSKAWYPYLSPFAEDKLRLVPSEWYEPWGQSEIVVKSVTRMWLNAACNMDFRGFSTPAHGEARVHFHV